MKVRLKATVTLIAEYEVDTDHYACKVHWILDSERAKLTLDPIPLLKRPGCQTFARVEEVK